MTALPPYPSATDTQEAAASTRHALPTIVLHWASALLVVAAFVLAWVRDAADDKPLRAVLLFGHSQVGLLVLLLLALRLAARWLARGQGPVAAGPALLRWAGTAGHLGLYGLLLAQPVLGWAVMNAHGHDPLLFGVWPLPPLAEADPDLADTLAEAHETAAWALLALIGLHACAALWHHHFRRDGVLASMLPWLTVPTPHTSPNPHTPE